jgi:selenocysteine-specific elongation factor
VIIATAGHVDHGKTALVKALTGVDTDRLPEEKKRGMTIDLGFAYRRLAGGGAIGFVDVPGHERFIHNMLAGMGGIDFVLLVIAADDGPMAQTREHLAIVDLLGVRRGAVALSKIDRVTAARAGETKAEIAALLAPTALAGAPVFALSAVTGEGVRGLAQHIERAARALGARSTAGNFRLAVDRAFSIAGAGLVVTGTATSGEIAPGDSVRASLSGVAARVRSIHAQNAPAERGRAGQRLALNLAGIDGKAPIVRGDWLVAGAVPAAVTRFDARLEVVCGRTLKHWTPVHVHLGTADVMGRVAVLGAESIAPGASSLVQLVLQRPIGALRADRFIVRDQSASRTLGGGAVVDVFPPARGRARPARIAYLAAMESEDHGQALAQLAREAKGGLDFAAFAANRNLTSEAAENLFVETRLKRAGNRAFSAETWNDLRRNAVAALETWHRGSPASWALPAVRLLEGRGIHPAQDIILALVEELAREGTIVRDGAGVRLPQHRAQLSGADTALWEKVRALLEPGGLRPPTVAELAAHLGEDARRLDSALSRLERQGLAVRVSKNRFFLPAAIARLREMAGEEARANGAITAAAFRDRTGIGRGLAIEVLEYLDRIRFTRRAGDSHLVVRAAHGRDSHPGGAPGLQIR